jgi:hypothetical protein
MIIEDDSDKFVKVSKIIILFFILFSHFSFFSIDLVFWLK